MLKPNTDNVVSALHCSSFSRETVLHVTDRNGFVLFVPLREQLMFPLHFVDMLERFDVEASVEGGGHSSKAGALRLAISRALLSFVSNGDVENMRQGECTANFSHYRLRFRDLHM